MDRKYQFWGISREWRKEPLRCFIQVLRAGLTSVQWARWGEATWSRLSPWLAVCFSLKQNTRAESIIACPYMVVYWIFRDLNVRRALKGVCIALINLMLREWKFKDPWNRQKSSFQLRTIEVLPFNQMRPQGLHPQSTLAYPTTNSPSKHL